MTYSVEELEVLWNAQADAYNRWDDLGLDEIVAFAQEMTMQWRPIDTAPRDGRLVLIYEPGDCPVVCIAEFGIGGWALCEFEPYPGLVQRDVYPSHWMPLPEPPK